MRLLNYRRHCMLLLVSTGLLLGESFFISAVTLVDRWNTHFALVGLLHATALAAALRVTDSYKRRIAFVSIATAVSIGAPYGGLALTPLLGLSDEAAFWSMLAVASGGGALAYWLLIRAFWLRRLPFWSPVLTVALCVVATAVSFSVDGMLTGFGSRPNPVPFDTPTIFWWAAFSGSLFVADRAGWLTPRCSRQTAVIDSA